MPLTPFALSSGNNTEKIVARTMIDMNHDFSYVVNCLANKVMISKDKARITDAFAKLKIAIDWLAISCSYAYCASCCVTSLWSK